MRAVEEEGGGGGETREGGTVTHGRSALPGTIDDEWKGI